MSVCTVNESGGVGAYTWIEAVGYRVYLGGHSQNGVVFGVGVGANIIVGGSATFEFRFLSSELFSYDYDISVGGGTPPGVPLVFSVQDSALGDQRNIDIGGGINDYAAVGVGIWTPEFGGADFDYRIDQNSDGSISLLEVRGVGNLTDPDTGDRIVRVQTSEYTILSDGSVTVQNNPDVIEIVGGGDRSTRSITREAFGIDLQGSPDEVIGGIKDLVQSDRNLQDKAQALSHFFSCPPSSPLILDLDGDGIELTSVDGSMTFFDLGTDGFAEATGWIGADDGFLALDVDGDGLIDNGSELFGDQTGHAHGFLALAVHDVNGDGVIDAQDAIFDELVIWQDLNADGISQTEEMRGLVEIGIASISVNATAADYEVAGNDILWESTFTWADGSTGLVVDAFFEGDPIRSRAVLRDDFEYHPDVFNLPVLSGIGHLASTMIVLSQDETLRQQAIDLVTQASSGDIVGFQTAFREFVLDWAGVGNVDPNGRGHVDGQNIAFLESVFNQNFWMETYGANPHRALADEMDAGVEALIDAMALEFLGQITVSNALLNSTGTSSYEALIGANPVGFLTSSSNAAQALAHLVEKIELSEMGYDDAVVVLELIEGSYPEGSDFAADMRTGLVTLESRTAATLDSMFTTKSTSNVLGTSSDDTLAGDGGRVRDVLTGGLGDDYLAGGLGRDTYVYALGDGSDTIQESDDSHWTHPEVDRLVFADLNVDDVTFGYGAGDDLLMTMSDGAVITIIDHVRHYQEAIEEVLFADGTLLDAADIRAKMVADQSTDGDDGITGTRSSDTITGGLGDDYMAGGHGADTYIYALGDGSDTIQETDDSSYSYRDIDRLVFTDLNADDVTFDGGGGGNLLITTSDGALITVIDHLDRWHERIDEIEFADGTVLDNSGINAKYVADQTTDGDDSIYGTRDAVTITGGLGDDYIDGGHGSDTYVYSLGDGSDTIQETDDGSYSYRDIDRLIFTDLNADDVTFDGGGGGNLLITTSDGALITVIDHLDRWHERIDEIEFADGTVLDNSGINAKYVADQTTDGDDSIYGTRDAVTITGGLGDDYIDGGHGSDTYVYALGHGSDTIQETDDGSHRYRDIDRFVFSDQNADDMTFRDGGGGNLQMVMSDGATITVIDHFSSWKERIDEVEFADGTVLNVSGIQTKVDDDALLV